MNQEKIGKFIQEMRKQKKMTQQELAEKLGVSDKSVSRWENGKNMPDVSLYKLLCDELNISVNDLISGEKIKEEEYKEKTDKNIIETITNENKKIKKIKNKSMIIICTLIIIILLLTFIFITLIGNKEDEYKYDGPKQGEEISKRKYLNPGRVSSIEKEDGWVCSFEISYGNEKKDYSYNCFNIKHQDIVGFNYYEYDSIKKSYFVSNEVPCYSNNVEYQSDILKVSEYFYMKQFDTKITINDLKELELNKINKEDIVKLFNETLDQELITKYGNLIENYGYDKWVYEYKSYDANITYIIGYYIDDYGYIRNVYLDFKVGNDKAANLISKKVLTKNQIALYNKLQEVKDYILKNQKFAIPKKYDNDKNINSLKDGIKFLNKNDGIQTSVYNDIRYVENEEEMLNQVVGPKH